MNENFFYKYETNMRNIIIKIIKIELLCASIISDF